MTEALRTAHRHLVLRRLFFLALVGFTFGALIWLLGAMLLVNGITPLECVIFVLSVALFLPITFSFWLAVAGFVTELRGGDPLGLDVASARADRTPLTARTALIMPVCNEDPGRVLAGLQATWDSLRATGHAEAFDLFVLSDTGDPRSWLEEELAVARATPSLGGSRHVHYRHRAHNAGHKAGNIADFCSRWGENYRSMIVLDADSVMSGESLVCLVRLMDRHPEAGIIQAPPVPVNRRTLFGRVQQFAAAAYGPTWATGLAWLQGGEGNYYGHNSILRIAPFMENCGLPTLPGRPPLGGSIMSHDFVEAALMRRAGFRVYLAPDLGGSYEEPPPTLLDHAARDRRWCQGNLQHARLLGMPGLHPVSRAHLFLGVMSYVSAPLWIGLLLVSTLEALRVQWAGHEYFAAGGALFPTWEVSIAARATLLFALVLTLLMLPRALALVSRLVDRGAGHAFGGAKRLVQSAACEWLLSMLLSPVHAVMQAGFVIGALAGRASGWKPQSRRDHRTTLGEALRRHAGTTLLGIVWIVLLARVVPALFWWMLPVLAGMTLAVPLSMWSSRVSVGQWARRRELFLTPEEVSPPPVLRALHGLAARLERDAAPPDPRTPLARLLEDRDALATHLRYAIAPEPDDALSEHRLDGLVLKCRLEGADALDDLEQAEVMLSPRALRELASAGQAPQLDLRASSATTAR